ncbi:hypothetical protein QBC39DRAFT_373735 [Podospora conica]|nr:hypothetical protein QBC39DRAFT_373735 [Schizothecium conicum]
MDPIIEILIPGLVTDARELRDHARAKVDLLGQSGETTQQLSDSLQEVVEVLQEYDNGLKTLARLCSREAVARNKAGEARVQEREANVKLQEQHLLNARADAVTKAKQIKADAEQARAEHDITMAREEERLEAKRKELQRQSIANDTERNRGRQQIKDLEVASQRRIDDLEMAAQRRIDDLEMAAQRRIDSLDRAARDKVALLEGFGTSLQQQTARYRALNDRLDRDKVALEKRAEVATAREAAVTSSERALEEKRKQLDERCAAVNTEWDVGQKHIERLKATVTEELVRFQSLSANVERDRSEYSAQRTELGIYRGEVEAREKAVEARERAVEAREKGVALAKAGLADEAV